ncbi:Tr-type G domain-containing protein [Plasmodiophora brassicae]|uniref:Tr-type G domain-containing protein n=1 Tax=Plasmodiophora brassicae TaxID=37360 RepID=A0A0G4IPI1_PLABS|nr:hypothetical protein PBRA_005710 [Plasmodiophora brassicae]SPR01082.1 unnamed protein product [Plasmodiophora brassicae]
MANEEVVRQPSGSGDIRIGVVGNVDAGKSTLIGVLTSGSLDDGRGLARSTIFRHKHEAESGRTSSISHHVLGFDAQHEPVYCQGVGRNRSWKPIAEKSESVIVFIDLAGHERYLKTTIGGLSGSYPDYVCVLVGANMGVSKMTKEHIGVAIALQIPLFVVVTKIDICPANVLKSTVNHLLRLIKSPQSGKLPVIIRNNQDIETSLGLNSTTGEDNGDQASGLLNTRVCPIFAVSCVSGLRIDMLKSFLGRLRPHRTWVDRQIQPAHMQIDDAFLVTGVGIVVSGTVKAGVVNANDHMLLGPFVDGSFLPVQIRSLQCRKSPMESASAGTACAASLRSLVRKSPLKLIRPFLRRGMVLVSRSVQPQACRQFEAEILVLHHPTTIRLNYQAVVHCGAVRQAAAIESIESVHSGTSRIITTTSGSTITEKSLRTGDKATVRFRFLCRPEYISCDETIIFREGGCKGIGTITRIIAQ